MSTSAISSRCSEASAGVARIVLYPSGRVVPYEAGQSVLEALEHAGFAPPHNCRSGACGECRMKVRAGDYDQGFVMSFALEPEDRAAGYGLMCKATIESGDLEIEFGTP